jgi:uncharacterized membrane protein (Fun14 family)
METAAEARAARTRVGLMEHAGRQPLWGKVVLAVAIALVIGGGVGWVLSRGATAVRESRREANAPAAAAANSRGFVEEKSATEEKSVDVGPLGRISPHAMGVGLSVVAGFVVGWLCRAFLKMTVGLVVLGAAVLAALSYFGVLNVDFSAAREHYANAAHWVTDQVGRLKDVVVWHLPSSGGGVVGAWMGFRRR